MASRTRPTIGFSDAVRDRALTAMLVVQCVIAFLAVPLATAHVRGARTVVEILFLLFGALVIVISRGLIAMAIAVVGLILISASTILTFIVPLSSLAWLAQIGNFAGGSVVGVVVGRAVLGPGKVTPHRVIGAIVIYLTIGLLFATLYRLLWDLDPVSLAGIGSTADPSHAAGSILYFSFATLTTVGYGDIIPVHPLARSLSNLESIIGQLYPATLLARLLMLEFDVAKMRGSR